MANSTSVNTVIIGGGIAGLTAAFYLQQRGVPFCLLEASHEPGGKIISFQKEGFTLELGPNTISLHPAIERLVAALGLQDNVLEAAPVSQHRFLYRDKKLYPVSPHPFKILGSKYISAYAKWRLFTERWRRAAPPEEEESAAEFVSRRFGKEILEYVFDPVLAGIYAGDPRQLSMQQVMPRLTIWEKEYGSVTRGLFKQKQLLAPRRIISFRGGMQTLAYALHRAVEANTRLNHTVQDIKMDKGKYVVAYRQDKQTGTIIASNIISTVPAYAAAQVIRSVDVAVADALLQVSYPELWVLQVGFEQTAVKHALEGFGFLIPSAENQPLLGAVYRSALFPDFTIPGKVLLNVFIGGAYQSALLQSSDEKAIIDSAIRSLQKILVINDPPVFRHLHKWPHAIPQLNVGHQSMLKMLGQFEQQHPGFYFGGNYVSGVAVGEVIRHAASIADKIGNIDGQI